MTTLVLDEFLPYRLSLTSNLLSEAVARTYRALFGLNIPEWRVLAVVAETGGTTQQAICARTRMDKVTVSRAAIALVDRGLLARETNRSDKRSHMLVVSPAGADLYGRIVPEALKVQAQVFERFERRELDALGAMLARIDEAVLSLTEERS